MAAGIVKVIYTDVYFITPTRQHFIKLQMSIILQSQTMDSILICSCLISYVAGWLFKSPEPPFDMLSELYILKYHMNCTNYQ